MKTKNIIYIYLISCVFFFSSLGDKSNTELAANKLIEIRNAYNRLGSYSVTVKHRYYKSFTNKTPDYEYSGVFAQAPPKYYSNLLGIKTIQNGIYKITLDVSSNLLVVDEADSSYKVQNIDFLKLLKVCNSVEFSTSNTGTIIHLQFSQKEPFKAVHLDITKKNLINKIKLVHNNSDKSSNYPVTEIEYSGFRFSDPQKDLFDFTGIVSIKESKVIIAKEYRQYTLLNNLLKF